MTPEEFVQRAIQLRDEHASCWPEDGCTAADDLDRLVQDYERDLTKED